MNTLPPLLLATRNIHKTQEIADMLKNHYTVTDVNNKGLPEIEETGTTFLENATLKAVGVSLATQSLVVADDSGLEVDALNGAPGVYSSSFGGEEGNHEKNNEHLLAELKKLNSGEPKTARFKCVMVIADKGTVLAHFEGVVDGRLIEKMRGKDGFGYDPLFIPEGHEKTFAELGKEIKNSLSHRGRALQQVVTFLQGL